MKTLHIDIVSDVACPWCAIGYKRLEKAMDELKDEIRFDIRWHAFRLAPDMPDTGEPILEHLTRKYGRSAEDMASAQQQMTDIAHGLGLDFSRMQERWAHNTTDAHRLLTWAREQDRQTELKLALFDAYFGRAENPSDPAVLRAAAESVGLSGEEAATILDSDRYRKEVEAEEARSRNAGITSVPAFIMEQKYLISGAQEPDTLVAAFREIVSEAAA